MGRPSKYSDEFRADAVALYRASDRSSVKAIANRIGINHETLRQWIRAAAEADSLTGVAGGLNADERAELARLRKAEREWQLEQEILRKAAQFFAKEMK
ncbi:transposase [Allorhizocola rhizosphaerae]|uniref:transposase n=1 Tax=Allorhizocola rhizosphaerae TaxID=1872709 RepID=UPI0013C2C122|nr:transposase [Allorhizocola rhizosphaerae]